VPVTPQGLLNKEFCKLSAVQVSDIGDQVKLFLLDMPGKSANVLTDEVYDDLDHALRQAEADPPRGIVLATAKPSIFVAGADLVKISRNLDWPDEEIFRFCEHGRSIMSRFSQMEDCVSVAAIHGVCVGGGLELPLWCDCRIASDSRRTLLGLPEVKLGLIPGWAGTVRLPRLIGFEPAVDLTISGDLVSASESMELGLVSLVVPEEVLIPSALQVIEREHYTKGYLKRREEMRGHVRRKKPKSIRQFRESTRAAIAANTEVDPVAPELALEHMLRTMKLPAAEACQSESRVFARLWGSPENRGLLNWFFVEERAKKTRPRYDGTPPTIRTVGVIGAGWMGSQIARLSARAGFALRIHDADERRSRKLVSDLQEVCIDDSTTVQTISSLTELADCALVIECTVEKLKIKQDLFRRICQAVSEETFLATNTSTIPVRDIAPAVTGPGRLFGLHFCWPVDPVRMVEVIRGDQTSSSALNLGIDLVRRFRKTPVVVADQPGFIVNRLLCPVMDQAIVMLQHGIDPVEMDRVFRDFGFSVGILEMIDFIGVDTIMYSGETFLRTLPDLISLTPILPALVKRGRLGRKSGRGFYRYESADGPPLPDEELRAILQKYQQQPLELPDQQILDRLLEPMVNEARKVLQEGVVPDSKDVDLCSILGTTFPRVKGGVLYWANHLKTQA
jgi:3-hydroxyacyl-CoA dehydrogenase/enoyl-CoA hydratase/3-hydroxybutyryl-CoA epimerase/3-hydroxyacyl-CoA dehydrogenase/enoyl-CoA hydratase/3-hydroxybutyryl-CoA epimerase/enoyl-CoA isomerase